MGTTGSNEKVAMNSALPDIIARIREYATAPLAVGFGVATRDHFNTVADAGADGVVIGSRLVTVMKNAPLGDVAQHVEAFCREISQKGKPVRVRLHPARTTPPGQSTKKETFTRVNTAVDNIVLPQRFGQFGGQYVPEALVDCLAELEQAHKSAMIDPEFYRELQSHFGYINRPSQIYLAKNLSKDAGGANIWLKREDLYISSTSPFKRLRIKFIQESYGLA